MDPHPILAHLDGERRSLARHGEILQILPDVTRYASSDRSHHSIIFSRLTSESADEVIRREIEFHRRLTASFEWKVYAHDQPGDLLERLARHGLMAGPCEAVMVLDLADPPRWIDEVAGGVRRIDRVTQIEDFRRVAEQVFNKNYAFTASELADAIRSQSNDHRGYIAYKDGQAASIGRLYTHPDSVFGGLYGGATLAVSRAGFVSQCHRGPGAGCSRRWGEISDRRCLAYQRADPAEARL